MTRGFVERLFHPVRALLRISLAFSTLAVTCALFTHSARSEEYPNRPVRIVLGFAAGGPTDILSRIIGDQLSKSLGAPMVVENRVGAGGNIAATVVAHSPADGYTLLVGGTNYAIGPAWYKDLQFDILKDFQIVTTISQNPNVDLAVTVTGLDPAVVNVDLRANAEYTPTLNASIFGTSPSGDKEKSCSLVARPKPWKNPINR